jgi:predicted Zn-dependent peptidase
MLLFGRPIPTQEIIAKIDEIDVGALRRAAGKLFTSKPTIAAMGALGALEPFDQTVRRFI